MNKQHYKIPEPTIKRLASYLRILLYWQERGIQKATSTMIADSLKIDSTQVRKDIQFTGISGKPKMGFDVSGLISEIQIQLNWDRKIKAYLVGVGSLGKSLLGYHGFRKIGIEFAEAFDDDPIKIGKKLFNVEVHPINKLVKLTANIERKIGVLAVPAISAQKIAEIMVEAGFKAIWNFSPILLNLEGNIVVENVQINESLALLTYKMNENNKEESIN